MRTNAKNLQPSIAVVNPNFAMTPETIAEKIRPIATKRAVLARLAARDDLGNLKIDVQQALEELDDLLEDFRRTFPDCAIEEGA